MNIEPYLFFEGRAEEAVEFYKKALGAEVQAMMRYSDMPPQSPTNANDGCAPGVQMPPEKVMHGLMSVAGSNVMFSDGMCSGKPEFKGVGLTINVPDVATANKYFSALSEGGQVMQPMQKTFFSEGFGMVADKFGLMWMVVTHVAPQ